MASLVLSCIGGTDYLTGEVADNFIKHCGLLVHTRLPSGKLKITSDCGIGRVKMIVDWAQNPQDFQWPSDYASLKDLLDAAVAWKIERLRDRCLWLLARDFNELCELNKEYILGRIGSTPYHEGPLDVETVSMIDGLLKLHNLGIFTFGSQPFEHYKDKMSQDSWTSGDWEEYQQRAFLGFFVCDVPEGGSTASISQKLFAELKSQPSILTRATRLLSLEVQTHSNGPVVASRWRKAHTEGELEAQIWTPTTTVLHILDEEDLREDFHQYQSVIQADPVLFEVVSLEWESGIDILDIVARSARAAGAVGKNDGDLESAALCRLAPELHGAGNSVAVERE